MVFNGSNVAENIAVSANGQRLRFFRDVANITMDVDGVERVDFNALGGADSVFVHSLVGTAVTQVNVSLAGTLGGAAGDAQTDNVVIFATDGIDDVTVAGSGTGATVTGLTPVVNITTAEAASDRLTINAGDGNDSVHATGLPSGVIALTLNGGNGDDVLAGSGGPDRLNGDDDNDTITGGGGDDVAQMGIGNDRFIWNPGDDTDLIEGNEGTDTVEVNGGNGAEDFTVTADGARVRFDRVNPAPFSLDIGTCENLVLNANGGNDTLACTGNLAALIQFTADGGAGDDVLRGGNGADVIIGGDGNDFIDGNQGNDTLFLGAGDDVFQWDPGDGSDVVEGQAGDDTMVFNGSNVAENIAVSANGQRLRFFRDVANITMDVDGVERVNFNALGGADSVVVNSLAGTAVTQVNVDLAGTLGGNAGDAQPDTVTVNGTAGADIINIAANAGAVEVSGLAASTRITHSEAANDRLTVNGLGGVDTITPGPGLAALIMLTINQD
jgi:Ca2+-binding RTX toxin-like protein